MWIHIYQKPPNENYWDVDKLLMKDIHNTTMN